MELKNVTSFPFYFKLACVLFSVIAMGYLLILGKEALSPMVFSCLFSILLLPLCNFFERKFKFPRSLASLISVIILITAISSILYLVGSQLKRLYSDWPQFESQVETSIDTLQDWISKTFNIAQKKQNKYVDTATSKIISSGTEVVGATVLSLSSILLFMVFTFIYTFFFLLYRRLIMKFLISVFLDENKNLVHDIMEQIQYIIRKYIVGLLMEMGIVATGVSLTFWIIGVHYAILLGLITGLFNIIPYIGIFTALIISCIITFATATAVSKVFLVMIVLVITHLIDSNIILPLVVGSKVRINALITVMGVIFGEMIWGVTGMFLSIPIIAVMKIIFDRIESLKPWGIILGDEEKKQNELIEPVEMVDPS
ncbi:MAG: AI-2E family transporter [Azospira oryzae]|jgi:putative permease|nr:MAG: AI-2E family transporter [Azospira oryzae]